MNAKHAVEHIDKILALPQGSPEQRSEIERIRAVWAMWARTHSRNAFTPKLHNQLRSDLELPSEALKTRLSQLRDDVQRGVFE